MSEKIESLITKIVQGNSAEAVQEFNQIISQKASEAIDNLRANVTDRMFNQGQYNESVGTYGNKRDYKKIDLYHKDTKKYIGSTTWSPNVKTAVQKAEEKWPEHAGNIKGYYAESTSADVTEEEFFLVEGGCGGLVKFGDDAGVKKATDSIKASLEKSGIKFGKSTSTVVTKDKDGNVVTKKETKDM